MYRGPVCIFIPPGLQSLLPGKGLVTWRSFFEALLEEHVFLSLDPFLALALMPSDLCLLLYLLGAGTVSCPFGTPEAVPFNPSGISPQVSGRFLTGAP